MSFMTKRGYKSENILQNILDLSDSQVIKMEADDNGIFRSIT